MSFGHWNTCTTALPHFNIGPYYNPNSSSHRNPDSHSTILDFFQNHKGNEILKLTNYPKIYEKYFAKFRTPNTRSNIYKPHPNILEIGVRFGGSLDLWNHYFDQKCQIYAVDIAPQCKQLESSPSTPHKNIKIFIGDQADQDFLNQLKSQLPPLDIIIDDGGHYSHQQIKTFETLFPLLKEGGIYMVEDTHASYMKQFNMNYQNPNSFISYMKDKVDQLHAWYSEEEDPQKFQVDYYTLNIESISFHNSITVIEKGTQNRPYKLRSGKPPNFLQKPQSQ